VLGNISAYPAHAQPEDGITYAHKIDKSEARLDFHQSAEQVLRQIRAFMPAPGAFFELEGERYKVLSADLVEGVGDPGVTLDDGLTIACGGLEDGGAIRIAQIQRAGKPAMAVADLLRGRPIPAGTHLA